MLIAKEMRWDEKIKDPDELIEKIRRGKAPMNIYLIYTTKSGKTEIASCRQAIGSFGKADEMRVIGAAVGKQAAFDMLAEMYRENI